MICLNCTTYTCSCHGGVVGLVYKNLIDETEEKMKKKSQFDEEEGFDWWFKKLIAPVQDRRKNKKSGVNAPDHICGSLYYCKNCDRLWEKTGSSGGAYPKLYIEYFTRKDLSFYGFKDDIKKHKICIRCK